MAVIRHTDAERVAQDAIVLDFGDLRREGEALLERTRAEAARIIEEANTERARILEGGRQQGFDEGKAEGFEAGHADGVKRGHAEALEQSTGQVGQLADTLRAIVDGVAELRESLEDQARRQLLDMSLQIARRIMHRIPQVDPGVVVDQLAHAIGQTLQRSDLVIRVSPDDLELAREATPDLSARLEQIRSIEFAADESLARGSCVVRARESATEIDASIDGQLDRITDVLLGRDEDAEA